MRKGGERGTTGAAKFCKRSEYYFVVGFHPVESTCRQKTQGMPTTMRSALQVINNLERDRNPVNLSRISQRGTEMDQNGSTLGPSPYYSFL